MKRVLLLFGLLISISGFASGGPGSADNKATVKLVYAEGKIFYHEVYVTWSTEFEKSSCEFFIEGSPDGESWSMRGRVKSNGAANKMTDYQFVDKRDPKIKYYRIRKLDSRSGSEILTKFEPDNYSIVVTLEKVFFQQEKRLVMEYSVDQDQELIVRVYNRIGEEVMTRIMPSKWAGDFIFQLDVSQLKPDNYILVVNQVLLDRTVAEKAFKID